jgi:hypothetical protein
MRCKLHVATGLCWLLFIALALVGNAVTAQTCHYQDWRWNVAQQRAVRQTTVSKDASMLLSDELDVQSGCSVCAEDQQAIKLDGLPEFLVCKKYAQLVQDTLVRLIRQGEKINSVIGYRVGRTRGDIDAQGNRSGFSNHSFGIAIDINTDHNGLYGNCVQFGPRCKLLRAGLWRPGDDPYSLQADGLIVKAFKQAGFKWGGEIEGQQKDFMHFSLTGY